MRAAAEPKSIACRASVLLAGACMLALALTRGVQAQEAGSAIYVHNDSDHTTVISPRLRVATPITDATRVQVVYGVDVWTSASVDIRASASKAVTEQRDEIDAQIAQDLGGDARLTAGYRYSIEPDYESHAASLDTGFDLAEHNTTLGIGGYASFDHVGRVGDPSFWRPVNTVDGRLTFTQVLDTSTFVQALYELSSAHGDLSSPYRFVAIGGISPYCRDKNTTSTGAPAGTNDGYCVPETNPESRLRHAAALSLRRALGPSFSAGLSYRFYLDDWDLMSHTIRAELSWLPDGDTILSLRYRFYTQTAAKQYQALYKATDLKFYTNDKELSPLSAHKIGLELDRAWRTEPFVLHTVLAIAPSFYSYSDFVPLDRITAFEVTLAVGMQR
jgi:hypothetical protein